MGYLGVMLLTCLGAAIVSQTIHWFRCPIR